MKLSKRQLEMQEAKNGDKYLGAQVTCSQRVTQDTLNREAISWKGTGWVMGLPSRTCKFEK